MATEHSTSVRDFTAQKEETERRIQQERSREAEMLLGLENERTTVADLTASVNHLQATLNRVKEQSAQVEHELNAVRKEVAMRRSEKKRQGEKLREMRRRDEDELDIMEQALGWRVHGVGGGF